MGKQFFFDGPFSSFRRVYRICTANPEPKSEELYSNISNYFEEKSQEKAMMLGQYERQQLLEEYTEKWTRYQVKDIIGAYINLI